MLVACMAGPMDTGQEIATYLLLHLIPIMIYQLVFLAIPKDPMLLRILANTLVKTAAWRLWGHPHGARPKKTKCFKKPKKKLISEDQEIQDTTIKNKLPTYLVPALFAALKVGCCIEAKLRRFLRPLKRAPRFLALQSAFLDNPAVQFDSDSFSIGINNHASGCMANAPHLFENLHLTNDAREVNGIGKGLVIKRKGTFKFLLKDNNGKTHTIKIQSLLTWVKVKAVPHIATTLGAGGRRRANMDGELQERVCAKLAWGRQENSLLQSIYEQANLHHGSVVPCLSHVRHNL